MYKSTILFILELWEAVQIQFWPGVGTQGWQESGSSRSGMKKIGSGRAALKPTPGFDILSHLFFNEKFLRETHCRHYTLYIIMGGLLQVEFLTIYLTMK